MLPELIDDLRCHDMMLFQWAPTLGGECYIRADGDYIYYPANETEWYKIRRSFNGHPPLGVNATV